jgi:hypothetical protein
MLPLSPKFRAQRVSFSAVRCILSANLVIHEQRFTLVGDLQASVVEIYLLRFTPQLSPAARVARFFFAQHTETGTNIP